MGAGKFSLDLSHNTKHKSSFSFFEVLQRDLVGGAQSLAPFENKAHWKKLKKFEKFF